jgi:hypothetical protein
LPQPSVTQIPLSLSLGRPIPVTSLRRICEVFGVPVARLSHGLDNGICSNLMGMKSTGSGAHLGVGRFWNGQLGDESSYECSAAMRSGNSTTSIWMRKWAAIPRGAHGDKRGRVVSFLSRAESLSQRRSRDSAPAVSRLRGCKLKTMFS